MSPLRKRVVVPYRDGSRTFVGLVCGDRQAFQSNRFQRRGWELFILPEEGTLIASLFILSTLNTWCNFYWSESSANSVGMQDVVKSETNINWVASLFWAVRCLNFDLPRLLTEI